MYIGLVTCRYPKIYFLCCLLYIKHYQPFHFHFIDLIRTQFTADFQILFHYEINTIKNLFQKKYITVAKRILIYHVIMHLAHKVVGFLWGKVR